MRFEYSPQNPDDWPEAITVVALEAGEDAEEGETRTYEPNWKHRVAGETIRRQRNRISELEAQHLNAVEHYGQALDDCRKLETEVRAHEQLGDALRALAAESYKLALDMWGLVPCESLPAEYGVLMGNVHRKLEAHGIEVE